jgi:integrase
MHLAKDYASGHDRDNAVHRLPLFPTRANDIHVPVFALEVLEQYRCNRLVATLKAGDYWQDHDYVFCTSIGTYIIPSEDAVDQLKALLKKAGLSDIRFHDLRYSAVNLLLTEGCQELFDHRNSYMTIESDVALPS